MVRSPWWMVALLTACATRPTELTSGAAAGAAGAAVPCSPGSAEEASGGAPAGGQAGQDGAGAGGSGAGGSGAGGAAGGEAGSSGQGGALCADEGCGEGMVRLGRFCVDAYEAHLVVTHGDGRREPWPHYLRPPADLRYEARSAKGMFPQGYISRVEAQQACKNAGKRLCSMGEWRRACQGKRGFLYGYGMKRKAGVCNSGKDHLLSRLYGTSGRGWKYDEHFNNPELNQLEGFLARSGEHPECTGGEGVYDLVGNLHEWVSDTLDDDLIEKLNDEPVERRKQPMREGNGLFLGGFFSTTSELGPGCKYVTAAHEPRYHDYSTGFRCCQTVARPPGTKGSLRGLSGASSCGVDVVVAAAAEPG